MMRVRRKGSLHAKFSLHRRDISQGQLSLDSIDETSDSILPIPFNFAQQDSDRDVGWQLRPDVSDADSMIIGASVSASLIFVMIIVLLFYWLRYRCRQRTEDTSRRSLWASTIWKRGPRHQASFVPLDDRHSFFYGESDKLSFFKRMMWRGKRSTIPSKLAHLSTYPSGIHVDTNNTSTSRATSPSTSLLMMEKYHFLERNRSREDLAKKRIKFKDYSPSPTLATPQTAHPSPHLRNEEAYVKHATRRGSLGTSFNKKPRSSAIRYEDVMPAKSSMSITEDEPVTSSTVCGLGLELNSFVGTCQPQGREVFNGFMQWPTPSPLHSAPIDTFPMSDASSMISFELAEVSGVIKPCFTIERIEEFTGPIYADQIASALNEAKMISSSPSISSNMSLSSADSNGDLSALFRETIAMLQEKPTLLRRSQVLGTKIRTRARSKTCPSKTNESLKGNNRLVSSEGRHRSVAIPTMQYGLELQWHLCLSPERSKKELIIKSNHSSRLIANVHVPGASIDSFDFESRESECELIPSPAHLLFQNDIDKTKQRHCDQNSNVCKRKTTLADKKRESVDSIKTTSTSTSSWDMQSLAFPIITSSPKVKKQRGTINRTKSTDQIDWRSSEYHSPTLQVFQFYQDDQDCFSILNQAQEANSSIDTL